MNRLPVIGTLIGAVGAVVVGYLIVPSQGEQLAMLVRDGHDEIARSRAMEWFDAGSRDPAILLQTFILNERVADYEEGMKALRAYFLQSPDDLAAWRKAAAIFKHSGQTTFLIEALETILRLSRDPSAASQLAALYRLSAKLADEYRVLTAIDSKALKSADALRLAQLLSQNGETGAVVEILTALDATRDGLNDEWRVALFVALLDLNEPERAVDHALRWQQDETATPLGDVFVGYLLRVGSDRAAIRLATFRQNDGDARAAARVAQLFSDGGRHDLISELIGRWLHQADTLPLETLDMFVQQIVTIARAHGLSDHLFAEFAKFADGSDAPRVRASLLTAMYNQLGYAAIAPFEPTWRRNVLSPRPVLAAKLMTEERNPLLARRYLLAASLPALSSEERFQWLAIAQKMLSSQELAYELVRRARAHAIPPDLKRAVLDAMLRSGNQPRMIELWQALFPKDGTTFPFESSPRSAGERLAKGEIAAQIQ